MTYPTEFRWIVLKDYYSGDQNFTDTWVILYGTEQEAVDAKAKLEAGQDKSWFDPAGDDEAVLYVDRINIAA